MASPHLEIDQQISKDRLAQLYRRSKTTSLALLIACSVYLLLLSKQFSYQSLLIWYTVFVFVLLGRMVLQFAFNRAEVTEDSQIYWLTAFRCSILAVGLSIGSLNILFFPKDPISFLLLAIFLPCGITAASVTVLVDFVSFLIYAVTLLTPIILQTVVGGDGQYFGTGLLTAVLAFFFIRFSRGFNENYSLTMRLRYENKNLVEELQAERNKLKNRLNRVLNDGFSEIFVADAANYNILMVNNGAIKNLGYDDQEFQAINLLDIFVQLDHGSLERLLKPLLTGRREVVIHNGYNRRKNGSKYPVEARFQLSTSDDPPIIVISAQDISERRNWEKKLIYQANFDQLTGLFNRHYMQSYMTSVFARAKRQKQKVALLFMDLDNFKSINDSMGHDTGDEVLKETAKRVKALLRETDTPARTGGDEFTILIEGLSENDHAELVAQKLVDIFQVPFMINKKEVYATASVGISIYPDDSKSLDQLMQYADIAMYHAKESGRNSHRFFSNEMRRFSEEQMLITNHLRYALVKKEFSLLFQPKIDIANGRIIGAESLLRWNNSELGNISPDTFIPLAENMGLMKDIGRWVLEEACKEAKVWQDYSDTPLTVSVNVSPQQFRSTSLLDDVRDALQISGLDKSCLEMEITESLLLHDSDQHLMILKSLNHSGIHLALDDFGTGYSSLSYLKRFPLQVLKIDRSFIHDLFEDDNSKALVKAIIVMAKSLKLEIVAEGVESEAQLEFLRQHEVFIAQGYFFSPPIPRENFRTLLQG